MSIVFLISSKYCGGVEVGVSNHSFASVWALRKLHPTRFEHPSLQTWNAQNVPALSLSKPFGSLWPSMPAKLGMVTFESH